MNKLEIKGIEYDMISSFDEMNLETFSNYVEVIQQKKGNLHRLIDIISLLSGINPDILKSGSIDSLKAIDISWILEPVTTEIKDEIEILGVKYGFVGDLKSLTLGEYADLEGVLEEEDKKYENVHKICAILYRPLIDGEVEEYDYNTMNERADIFLNELPITISNPVVNFFLTLKDTF